MATNTMVALQTQVLGSSASSVTFSSIPQGYTDLMLVMSAISDSASVTNLEVQVGNGSIDTTSSYSLTSVYGTGSAANSTRLSSQAAWFITRATGFDNNAGRFMARMNFMNYSNTTTYKTMLNRIDVPAGGGTSLEAEVCLWSKTNAIDTIKIFPQANNIAAGSTFTLYAIQAA